jgi:hypothetical protein
MMSSMNVGEETTLAKFHKRPHIRLFIFLVVLFFILIGAVKFTAERLGHDPNNVARPVETDYQRAMASAYEKEAAVIVRAFVAGEGTAAPEQRLAAIATTRDELLALTVPTKYKDLHLDLIVALSQLEVGYQGDAARLEVGRQSLRQAQESYSWLR